jgi:hypothetical protein
LALGLHDALATAGGARIVSVSSSGHLRSPVIFDDLDYDFRDYDPFGAYEQGAATSVLLAASPLLDGVGGRCFEDCNGARVVERRGEVGSGGVAPYALDPANAERLWEVSLDLVADGR